MDPRTRCIRLLLAGWLVGLAGTAAGQMDAALGYEVRRTTAPRPDGVLLDSGAHFEVKLAQEGQARPVQVKVAPGSLEPLDLASLHLARFNPKTKLYEDFRPLTQAKGDLWSATLSSSGVYSLIGMPADPVARGGLDALCRVPGPMPRSLVDPICTKIYCAGLEGWRGSPALPGEGPGFGPGTGASVCDRCLRTAGRAPAQIGECGLLPAQGPELVLPDLVKIPWPPLLMCPRVPSLLADPSATGLYPVGSDSYKLVDALDIDADDQDIDVWATVRYPASSAGTGAPLTAGTDKLPLIVYMHGNHGIWVSGGGAHVCSPSSSTPVPNHEGYDYVLERLASLGFIAVSINANDLNCKSDRIVERGKLILEHLRRWRQWADPSQADTVFAGRFHNRVDLARIGLAGHSRGGEAVVAAYLENQAAGLGFGIGAVHSIAPVDFKGYVLKDVPYYLLLPAADGDVSDLQGARIYDRAAPRTEPDKMPKMQSVLYGANHNWFNTVWFQDEGSPPSGGADRIAADRQRAVERIMAVAFFRKYLQGYQSALNLFTGRSRVAELADLALYRSYQDPKHRNVDDFEDAPVNAALNSLGGANTAVSLSPFAEHPFRQGAGAFNASFYQDTSGLVLGWNARGDELVFNLPAGARDVRSYNYLSFRVTQVFDNGAVNPPGAAQDFDVGLEDAAGNRIYLQVADFDVIPYPYVRPFAVKSLLHTVRLPLNCYGCSAVVSIDKSAVTRVRLRFSRKPAGTIGIDSVQFSR